MWYLFTYINFWIFKDDCFEEMEVLYEILYIILKSLKYIFIFIYNFMNKCVLWEYFKFNLKLVAPVEDIVWQRWDQLEDGKVITQGTSGVEDIYKRMHLKKHSSTHSLYDKSSPHKTNLSRMLNEKNMNSNPHQYLLSKAFIQSSEIGVIYSFWPYRSINTLFFLLCYFTGCCSHIIQI